MRDLHAFNKIMNEASEYNLSPLDQDGFSINTVGSLVLYLYLDDDNNIYLYIPIIKLQGLDISQKERVYNLILRLSVIHDLDDNMRFSLSASEHLLINAHTYLQDRACLDHELDKIIATATQVQDQISNLKSDGLSLSQKKSLKDKIIEQYDGKFQGFVWG